MIILLLVVATAVVSATLVAAVVIATALVLVPTITIIAVLRVLDTESDVVNLKGVSILGLTSLLVFRLPFSIMGRYMDAFALEEIRLQDVIHDSASSRKRDEISSLDAAVILCCLPLLLTESSVHSNSESGLAHLTLTILVVHIKRAVVDISHDTSFKLTYIVYVSHCLLLPFLFFKQFKPVREFTVLVHKVPLPL